MSDERWRPIPGYEGTYEVSDLGRVRSVDRWVSRANGGQYRRRGKVLAAHPHPRAGYPLVKLKINNAVHSATTHALVMLAFVGPRPEGLEVCHNNGDPTDNRPANLRYDTRSENRRDSVRHGTHSETRKTRCRSGHPFDEVNTIRRSDGSRDCRICRRERSRASRARLRLAG